MSDKLPSAEELAAFIADSSPSKIDEIIQPAMPSFGDEWDSWDADSAERVLIGAYEIRIEFWKSRFDDDHVLRWMHELESVKRAGSRIMGRRARMVGEDSNASTPATIAKSFIEHRLSTYDADGKRLPKSDADGPFRPSWIVRCANGAAPGWRWMHGLAKAFYDYLWTDMAAKLINERKTIESILADAIKGFDAIEIFLGTSVSQKLDRSHIPGMGSLRRICERRAAIDVLGQVRLTDFYPLARQDVTASERLLVTQLCDLHLSLFRVPKPEAISDLMDSTFIKNPLDSRTIEKICKGRREARRSLDAALVDARHKYQTARQLLR